jgi:hypothetical protein
MNHFKIDLLSDEALAADATKEGDILTLRVPGNAVETQEKVISRTVFDAGKHPDTGEHLNRVSLELETQT